MLEAYKEALLRPLQFVIQQGKDGLSRVKNLEQHILQTCQKAQEDASLSAHAQRHFASISQQLNDFPEIDADTKLARLRTIYESMHALNGDVKKVEALFAEAHHPIYTAEQIEESHKKLYQRVQYLKGVGPKLAERMITEGLVTVADFLLYFPYRYEDRRSLQNIADLKEGVKCVVQGEVIFSGIAFYKGVRKQVFEAVVRDHTGELKLKWFHFRHLGLEKRIKREATLILSGTPRAFRGHFEMHHPDIEVNSGAEDSLSFGKLVPVYREFQGVSSKKIRRIIFDALPEYSKYFLCTLPPALCASRDRLSAREIVERMHVPSEYLEEEGIAELERVLGFEELYYYCMALLKRKAQRNKRPGISFSQQGKLIAQFKANLPFQLTGAQEDVIQEILEDMGNPHPMNRLLQGDVGSGKTAVAMIAALMAVENGYQVAFMAPTEILAEQHLLNLQKFYKGLPLKVASLLGRHTKTEKKEIQEQLLRGDIHIVVGTHALIENQVQFKKLGLVIVDEQHRFGVQQRSMLKEKGTEPDVLVMSATPIPRTLAMTLYGDLDVSMMRELPKGRIKIESRFFEDRDRGKAYLEIEQTLKRGEQVFVVYPLVEASELIDLKDATTMTETFQKEIFPGYKVGLIHGQMKSAEKEAIMLSFKARELDLLVATTVIEVGIDVPNATAILIEHPERLGLSQLHQLRGRVGRGTQPSKCILLANPQTSHMARDRLKKFCAIHDGFALAEEDLKIRGPGNFFGKEQSGLPKFSKAVFPRDLDLLEQARREVEILLKDDPELEKPEHLAIKMTYQLWIKNRLHFLSA